MYLYEGQENTSGIMKLTKHTDYAFRVLIYLSAMKEEKITIQEITDLFNISKTHLMKVVNELANKGWVNSTRGKNGGICLGKAPSAISLKDVLIHMEKTLEPINCTSPMCYLNSVCNLKPILIKAQEQYLDYLGSFTLQDLVDDKTKQIIIIQ